MYMYTDLDKKDFCKDWMKHHGSVNMSSSPTRQSGTRRIGA